MRRKVGSRARRLKASPGLARNARAVELMVQCDFLSSLMMLRYCVLHVLKHFLHWNGCVEDMWSHLQLEIGRNQRTKASFSHLPFLEFEGTSARKLRLHIFNSSNLTEASHESFVFTSPTRGILTEKHRTKASYSHLPFLI